MENQLQRNTQCHFILVINKIIVKMKTYFNNITFYWILISLIPLLLLLNLLTFVVTINPIALLPIIIQSLLLYLIFTNKTIETK